jgi:hypothetical protein
MDGNMAVFSYFLRTPKNIVFKRKLKVKKLLGLRFILQRIVVIQNYIETTALGARGKH